MPVSAQRGLAHFSVSGHRSNPGHWSLGCALSGPLQLNVQLRGRGRQRGGRVIAHFAKQLFFATRAEPCEERLVPFLSVQ